jgi:FkbM family methyltransferase
MISFLLSLYRKSPFWLRNVMAKLTWPIRILMSPFSTIKIGSHKMALNFSDNASFKYYVDRERYEYIEVTAFLASIIHNPGSYVIDIGANYGSFALFAANLGRFNCFKKILAIEPDRRPYNALVKSVKQNGFEKFIEPFQLIVGDQETKQRLFVNSRSSADNRSHQVTDSSIDVREINEVNATTLDSLLETSGIDLNSKFIIKMDIQGNEPRAFKGMSKALAQSQGFILFFEHAPYLIKSAGSEISDFIDFIKTLQLDHIYEIAGDDIIALDGFEGLFDSFNTLENTEEKNMQGSCSNYIFCKGMDLE